MAPEQATNPKYWGDQLRHTVRFAEGISMLSQEKRRILLEVGPGQTLTRQVARSGRASADIVPIASLPSGREGRSDRDEQAEILTALGKLWLSGISITWSKFHAAEKRRRLPLPTYPFQHQRYWVEAKRQSTIAHPSDLVNLPGIPSDCQESNGERPGETHHPEQGGVGSYPGLDDQNNRLYPRPRLSTPLVPARSETEKIIAEIWQKTLGIASVGILDNFFDLGGDSLTAIRIIAQLKERMGADLPVVNLYESLNIKSLAEQFENSRDDECRKHVVDSGINERSERVQSRKQHQANRRNRRVKS